jgi:tetratricopeptide (TPR) repeat protein
MLNLAALLRARGDFTGAKELRKRAYDTDTNNFGAVLSYSSDLIAQSRIQDALKIYLQYKSLDKQRLLNLGMDPYADGGPLSVARLLSSTGHPEYVTWLGAYVDSSSPVSVEPILELLKANANGITHTQLEQITNWIPAFLGDDRKRLEEAIKSIKPTD